MEKEIVMKEEEVKRELAVGEEGEGRKGARGAL